MTEQELIDAIATKLRAYATDPLASWLVYSRPQIAYGEDEGRVIVGYSVEGVETGRWIGAAGFTDDITLVIRAEVTVTRDTAALQGAIHDVCAQIREVLADNRNITVGDTSTISNDAMSWTTRLEPGPNDEILRVAEVTVTYICEQAVS